MRDPHDKDSVRKTYEINKDDTTTPLLTEERTDEFGLSDFGECGDDFGDDNKEETADDEDHLEY